ncbi:hypothetical protein ACI7RC_24960 [Brevibacillus sp. B_LB10_24]|uniref:hypothetical protein n=1 Tax=Brevibacillus sp. B_LB10_24 TaxID=3380645 RepID=UPI0038BC10EF
MKRKLGLSLLMAAIAVASMFVGAYASPVKTVLNGQDSQGMFMESELPGGGLQLPKNQRLHLLTDQKWVEKEGHLSDLIRLQWVGDRAKPAIAWADENGKDKAAIIAHDKANDPSQPPHKHISIETTMSPEGEHANELFTRFEVPFDQDVAEINTHSSNFTVRSGAARVTGEDGQNKEFQIQKENDTKTGVNRWAIRGDSTRETGNNAGSDFQIVRFDDEGGALDAALSIIRSNGYVGINTTTPERRLDVNDNRIRVRSSYTPASSSAEGKQGDIAWDENYLYVCVKDNNWKRMPLSSW